MSEKRNIFTEYKNHSYKTWKIVKTLVPNKHYTGDCTNYTHNTEHFNYFFLKIGKATYEQTDSTLHKNTDRVRLTTHILRLQPVDVEPIILVPKDLRGATIIGADCLTTIAYLTVINNTSLVTDIFRRFGNMK